MSTFAEPSAGPQSGLGSLIESGIGGVELLGEGFERTVSPAAANLFKLFTKGPSFTPPEEGELAVFGQRPEESESGEEFRKAPFAAQFALESLPFLAAPALSGVQSTLRTGATGTRLSSPFGAAATALTPAVAAERAAGVVIASPFKAGAKAIKFASPTMQRIFAGERGSAAFAASDREFLRDSLEIAVMEREGLAEFLASNPLARVARTVFGPAQTEFGATLTAKQVLNLRAATTGAAAFKGTQAQALAEVKRLYPTAVTAQGRIRSEYVLDDVVTQLGRQYEGVGGPEKFMGEIQALAKQQERLRLLDTDIVRVESELKALPSERTRIRQGPGQPEAGVQLGGLGVPSKEIRPLGKGRIVQESLDDQLKLVETRREGTPPRKEGIPPSRGGRRPPGGGERPPEPPTPASDPDKFIFQSQVSQNVINLEPVQVGLSKAQELANIARRTIGRPFKAAERHPMVEGAFKVRGAGRRQADSVASVLVAKHDRALRQVFKFDKQGRIAELANIDPTLVGTPTIQDVAARLPRYLNALTNAQRAALEALRDDLAPYRQLLKDVGVEVPFRQDVMEGGFYIPRGRAALEGSDAPFKIRAGGGVGGKKGFEKVAVFDSQTEGINAGYEYASFADALGAYARDAGNRATDQHLANFFRSAVEEGGQLLAETAKMRMLRQNRSVALRMEQVRREVERLRSLTKGLTEKANRAIDDFLLSPGVDDIDDLLDALPVRITRGRSAGATAAQVNQSLKRVLAEVRALRPEYKAALRRAQSMPREQGTVDISGLQGVTFPDEIANAANAILRGERGTTGPLAVPLGALEAFNNLYRGLRATMDNSAPGIQGLLGFYGNQKAFAKALSTNFRAWGVNGDQALGKFIEFFDATATQTGRLPSSDWARLGLRVGGVQTEFMLGRGFTAPIAKLPGVRLANRAFGYFGDSLRLAWADDMLRNELRSGRTMRQMLKSGDLRRIATITNNMTGYAEGRTFGSVGDFMLFAPRFLQSRLETVSKAGLGLRPGATLDQRAARSSIMRMVGFGTMMTVGVNEMLGNDTDFRPFVNGRYNSNFLRIRFGGRDWSLFGTWDSLARLIVTTAGGRPREAVRSMGSGIVANVWDLYSGENFIGERVRDNPEQFARRMLENLTPFAAEEIPQALGRIKGGDVVGGGTTIVGELFGAKSAPLSRRDQLDIIVVDQGYKSQEGKLLTRYDQLNQGQRREARNLLEQKDPGRFAGLTPDVGSARQQTTSAIENLNRVKAEGEAELRAKIDAGAQGTVLREAIQGMKEGRFNASEALLGSAAVQGQLDRGNKPPEDVYASRYWSVDVPEDKRTGDLDFNARDAERQKILAEARQAGIDTSYITGTKRSDYRGKRFADPEVRRVVEEYEAAVESLRPYWDVADQLLDSLTPAGVTLWQRYLEASPEEQNVLSGTSKRVKDLLAMKTDRQDRLRVENPSIDVALVRWYGRKPKTREGNDLYQQLYVGPALAPFQAQQPTPRPQPVRSRPRPGPVTVEAFKDLVGAR